MSSSANQIGKRYLIATAVIALIVAFMIPETDKKDLD